MVLVSRSGAGNQSSMKTWLDGRKARVALAILLSGGASLHR